MPDFSDDIPLDMQLARRRDTDRFMIFDINRRFAPGNRPAVTCDDVRRTHPVAQFGHLAVDRDRSRLDQAVRLASGTNPMLREKLVNANCGGHRASTPQLDFVTERLESGSVYSTTGLNAAKNTIN